MATTAPIGARGLALRVARQGLDAAVAGLPVNACPYDRRRPFSRRVWLRGFLIGVTQTGGRRPSEVADDTDVAAPEPSGDTPA